VRTELKKLTSAAAFVKAKARASSVVTELSAPTASPFLQRKAACACGGSCPQCQVEASIQPKLKIGTPDDKYEQEADRVADQVMRMPEQIVQRLSMDEENEEDQVQTKNTSNTVPVMTPSVSANIQSLQGCGHPLSMGERNFFEPRFGRDFSGVRLHTDASAASISRRINAHAFTLGNNIVFSSGQYAPQTNKGRQLLAHELTHVVQQTPNIQRASKRSSNRLGIRQHLSKNMIAGAWQILHGQRRLLPNGQTDEQLLLAAFRQICPLATFSAGEISVPLTGAAPSGRQNGCQCLRDIERWLPRMKISRPPATIEAEQHGWSSTQPRADPVWVKVRHPDDPFSWGYWTNITENNPEERRHQKPFWQTLAHEICGHVWRYVRTGGRRTGGRGGPRGHDPAIEGENLIAGEHGVVPSEQRGFEHERGDRPATEHAGESFITATVSGFQHRSDATAPTNAPGVVSSAAATIALRLNTRRPLRVELEGFAYANEGGSTLAEARARSVMLDMIMSGIPYSHTTVGSTQSINTFRVLPGKVSPGSSQQMTSMPGRKVKVYLFHNPRSAQHDLLPAKVFFDTNQTAVRGVSQGTLNTAASFLVANPTLSVELIGRADSRGQASYNLQLAKLRAESVAQELLNRNVNASQIRTVTSQGESQARAQSTITTWQDRHVEIRL